MRRQPALSPATLRFLPPVTWETLISTDMCSPTLETHIPSDMFPPTWETRIPSDMCSPTLETRIPSGIFNPIWETHIPSDYV